MVNTMHLVIAGSRVRHSLYKKQQRHPSLFTLLMCLLIHVHSDNCHNGGDDADDLDGDDDKD